MGFSKITKFALAAIAVATMLNSVASAQPHQKPLRWLGEGYSAGYHRCTPGPDTSYYNPWNAHNSMLISRLPQFQQHSFQSFNLNNLHSRPVYQGVPFSVYAAPNQNHFGYDSHGFSHAYQPGSYQSEVSGDLVESTYEQYDDDEPLEDVEDLPEDKIEDTLDQWQDDEWDDQDEGEWMEDDDDSARLQAPGQSVFVPASHPTQSQPVPSLEGNVQSNQGSPSLRDNSLFNPFPGQ